MKTTSNKDMLNAIRNQASAEYQERIPAVTSDMEAREMLQTFNAYPTAKNEFIVTLTDKVVKTEFFSKVYTNPLKMLKKGMMPYGSSIEELFVKHAEAKGFFKKYSADGSHSQNQTIGNHEVGELVGYKKPDVKALYITKNYAHVFEVSISDAQLKAAFTSANGLSELVNQLVGSLTSGAELREYKDMITLLKCAAEGKYLSSGDDGLTQQPTKWIDKRKGVAQAIHVIAVEKGTTLMHNKDSWSHNLAVELRTFAQQLKFMSSKYNMAGVETFSSVDDLVFLTTPRNMAEMDVDLLAQAFNISKAEAQLRVIVVDELPKKFVSEISSDGGGSDLNNKYWDKNGGKTATNSSEVECLGMLIDRNFIQVIDTVNESRQFENGRALMTNLFLHKQGLMANCYFANAIAFIKKTN